MFNHGLTVKSVDSTVTSCQDFDAYRRSDVTTGLGHHVVYQDKKKKIGLNRILFKTYTSRLKLQQADMRSHHVNNHEQLCIAIH